jgi:hypothetical protein
MSRREVEVMLGYLSTYLYELSVLSIVRKIIEHFYHHRGGLGGAPNLVALVAALGARTFTAGRPDRRSTRSRVSAIAASASARINARSYDLAYSASNSASPKSVMAPSRPPASDTRYEAPDVRNRDGVEQVIVGIPASLGTVRTGRGVELAEADLHVA